MHELATATFAPVLQRPSCDDCGSAFDCHEPVALTIRGVETTHMDHPDAVVAWPKCPWNWDRIRQQGSDWLRLSDVLSWHHELGTHKNPRLTVGSASLMRRWWTWRELPQRIAELRALDEAKAKRP